MNTWERAVDALPARILGEQTHLAKSGVCDDLMGRTMPRGHQDFPSLKVKAMG